ncbi:MAG: PorV/PorQ family protein, partial [Elusimicrobiales bacterium]
MRWVIPKLIIYTFPVLIHLIVNTFLFAGSAGVSGALFLNYSPSARASAMANSFSSVTDDVFSIYYNPAGLVNVEQVEIGASYIKSFEDMSNQYLSVAYPYKPGRILGFAFQSFSNGDIQGYDAMGSPTGKVDTSNKAVTFSYSKAFTKDEIERAVLEGGVNLKYISQTLDGAGASTFAFDVGAIYNIRPDKYWLKDVPAQE